MQYNGLKQGIKNDAQNVAFGLFSVVGFFLLALSFGGAFIYFFAKENHYSTDIKTIVGAVLLILLVLFLGSARFRAMILKGWVGLLLILFILLCIATIGLIFYITIYKNLKGIF